MRCGSPWAPCGYSLIVAVAFEAALYIGKIGLAGGVICLFKAIVSLGVVIFFSFDAV